MGIFNSLAIFLQPLSILWCSTHQNHFLWFYSLW